MYRVRTQDLTTATPVIHSYWYHVTSTGTVVKDAESFGGQFKWLGTTRYMYDTVTPEFHRKVSSGQIVNNEMRQGTRTETYADSGFHMQKISGTSVYHGDVDRDWGTALGRVYHNQVDAGDLESLKNEIATKAHAGVAKPSVGSGINILKLRETLQLLRNPLGSAGRHIQSMLNTNSSTVRRLGGAYNFFEHAWLTGRYGFRPLVRAMDGAVEGALRSSGVNLRDTSRASGSIQLGEVTQNYSAAPSGILTRYTVTTQVAGSVRCGILYEWDPEWNDLVGLNLSTMPYTAWDAVPFSFVAGWIVNVSDLLLTLGSYKARHLAAWTMLEISTQSIRTITQVEPISGWTVTRQPVGGDTLTTIERHRYPSIRSPGIAWNNSALGKIFSFRGGVDLRWIDAFTLSTALFRSR